MGLLKRLFRKPPAVTLQDPVFGDLTFEDGIWLRLPADEDSGLMITIVAPESGPSDLQRDLYRRISTELGVYERRAKAFLAAKIGNLVAVEDLSPYAIEISDDGDTRQLIWALELADQGAFDVHRLCFQGAGVIDDGTYG